MKTFYATILGVALLPGAAAAKQPLSCPSYKAKTVCSQHRECAWQDKRCQSAAKTVKNRAKKAVPPAEATPAAPPPASEAIDPGAHDEEF